MSITKARSSSKCNRCSCLSPKISLLYLSVAVSILLNDGRGPCFVSAMATTPSSASIMRRAIELSNKANADPSFGKEACRLWKSVLYSKESSFPLAAMSAAHGLHACTLARIGKDKEAIVEYTTALGLMEESGALSNPLTKDEISMRVGIGRSLQRLFRYEAAADAFLKVAARCADIDDTSNSNDENNAQTSWVQMSLSNSVRSAALCCMRNGDLGSAFSTIEKYEGIDAELDGMYGALLLLKLCSAAVRVQDAVRHESFQRAMRLLFTASANSSPLYKWIFLASHIEKRGRIEPLDRKTDDTFLALAGINNCAFDDPDLINLDDKVRLHSILMNTSSGFSFWPQGLILPVEYDSFQSELYNNGGDDVDPGQMKWILKERNGYGSHGNMLASTDKVLSMYDSGEFDEPILCQRIVDPPLLIDGRKFSLRIYVVYFPRGIQSGNVDESLDAGVFICTEGLVKYAASTYDGVSTNLEFFDNQYMTNSGRGDGRSALQQNLLHLQNELQRSGINYREMWKRIEQSVQIVMARYLHLQSNETPSQLSSGQSFIPTSHLPFCCIPKILGFDYILDSSAKPFLLEVNRFPGLEPRSAMDSLVKHTVVYDAWVMASDRTGLPNTLFRNFRPPNHKGSSLKQLI